MAFQRLYIECPITPRKKYSLWIDDDQADGLKEGKERDGVLEDEQIRRRQGRSHELAGGRIDVSVDAVQAGAVPIRTFWL